MILLIAAAGMTFATGYYCNKYHGVKGSLLAIKAETAKLESNPTLMAAEAASKAEVLKIASKIKAELAKHKL
jgi:hypothetical protein